MWESSDLAEFDSCINYQIGGWRMPKQAKELSAVEVKRIVRPGNHAVGGVSGLLLRVKPTGARSWVLRVKAGDKRRDIGLGGFPDVPLAQAREKAREIKGQVREGKDPAAERKAAREALIAAQAKEMTFRQAAKKCHDAKRHAFRSIKHRADWINSLETHVFPIIGNMPIDIIEAEHVRSVLEPIWHEKTETATRVRQRMESIFSWAAVAKARSGPNPARWKENLEFLLSSPTKIRRVQHFRALPYQGVSEFMQALRHRGGMAARALEFIILTAARSGEARLATWSEVDLDRRLWTIPGERMKAGKTHKVPLSDDAVELLKGLPRIKGTDHIFTGPKGTPLSDMSILAVCKRMGIDATPHGFRSSFKDWCRTSTRYADEVSELALAHVNSDATRAAYARDELLPQRSKLMQEWAKYLRTAQGQGDVVPIRRSASGDG